MLDEYPLGKQTEVLKEEILVCVVHLKAKKDYEMRADELLMVMEEIERQNVKRIFIVGDFNEEQEDVADFL